LCISLCLLPKTQHLCLLLLAAVEALALLDHLLLSLPLLRRVDFLPQILETQLTPAALEAVVLQELVQAVMEQTRLRVEQAQMGLVLICLGLLKLMEAVVEAVAVILVPLEGLELMAAGMAMEVQVVLLRQELIAVEEAAAPHPT
jgi:hypothetical protein